jgi:hypothetical protein
MGQYYFWLIHKELRTDLYRDKAGEDVRLLLLSVLLVVLRLVALCEYLYFPRCARHNPLDEAVVHKLDNLVQW